MLAGIIFLVVGVIGIVPLIMIWKGHIELVTGYNTLSEKEKELLDKNKLKKYVIRILIPEILLLIEAGIVFIVKLVNSAVVFATILIILIPIIGVILYTISKKCQNKIVDISSIILTLIFLIASPTVLYVLTFL